MDYGLLHNDINFSEQFNYESSVVICEMLLQKQLQEAVSTEEGRDGILTIFYTT
jgi:hypothetical protein